MRRFFTLPLLLVTASTVSAATLEVPAVVSFHEAPVIRVSGLPPLHPVTLRASFQDASGATFTSSARFTPHVDGTVDTRVSIANGDYEGVDPMGLFWSLAGKGPLPVPLTGSLPMTIDVLDAKGQTIASASMQRRVVPDDVSITELRKPASPIVGRFYRHAGNAPRPAVVTLNGSGGGIDEKMAPFFASHGYDVLALAFFHFEGLPNDLLDSPLESFRDAMMWLREQPAVDRNRVVLAGFSKGAEAALVTASAYPDLVRGVVAFLPTHVVWEGIDARARFGGDPHFEAAGRSSWSAGGKPLAYVRKSVSAARLGNRPPLASLDAYEPALEGPIDPDAFIRAEKIRAPILLVSAGDDLAWPSLRMARAIKKRLSDRHFAFPVEVLEFPVAGHVIAPPGYPAGALLGGTPANNAHASVAAWTRALAFLQENLRR